MSVWYKHHLCIPLYILDWLAHVRKVPQVFVQIYIILLLFSGLLWEIHFLIWFRFGRGLILIGFYACVRVSTGESVKWEAVSL